MKPTNIKCASKKLYPALRIKSMVPMLIAILSVVIFQGCTPNSKGPTIGLVQIVEHPSLNAIRDHILAELALHTINGEAIRVTSKSAQNEISLLSTIIQTFRGEKKQAIVAIATSTAQAAALVSEHIPVIFAAVSDPVAAGLVSDLSAPEQNITGTSDELQVNQILDLARLFQPDLKKLGLLYNGSEVNSLSNIKQAKEYAHLYGIEIVELTVSTIGEVQQASAILATKVDAIFTPNDNTIASAIAPLIDAANQQNIPVYVGADSMVRDGGFATIGIDYEELGKETAKMIVAYLEGTPIRDIPVKVFKDDLNIYINQAKLLQLGFDLPASLANNPNVVFIKE